MFESANDSNIWVWIWKYIFTCLNQPVLDQFKHKNQWLNTCTRMPLLVSKKVNLTRHVKRGGVYWEYVMHVTRLMQKCADVSKNTLAETDENRKDTFISSECVWWFHVNERYSVPEFEERTWPYNNFAAFVSCLSALSRYTSRCFMTWICRNTSHCV